MAESIEAKRERAKKIIRILKEAYPDARCSLNFSTPHELLVATILAAQCTDEKVNQITPKLFKKYPDVYALADADLAELEQVIRPTGFFRQKAKSILESSQDIVSSYGGNVPDTLEELTKLRGVGRKTANLILGVVYKKPAIIVDTHVSRVANRLGLTDQKDPTKIEFQLREVLEEADWTVFNHLMVFHGRAICKAPTPRCEICPVLDLCPFGKARMAE